MKKLLSLLIPVLGLASCGGPEGYTIKAYLSGIPDSTMFYLDSFDAEETIDSVRLLNGKLKLRGTMAAPPELLRLRAQLGEEYLGVQLLIGNEKVTIRGDRADFPFELKVSGSKFEDERQILVNTTKAISLERDSLCDIYLAASTEEQDAMFGKIWGKTGRITEIDKMNESLHKTFILSHINTYAALSELGWMQARMPRDTVEMLYKSLSPEMQQSRYGKAVEVFLNVKRVQIGEPYYDIQGLDASGKEMKLSDIKTDYLLLDLTSIGCGPCRKSTPELREIDSLYRGRLTVVSISMDKSKNSWQEMIREDKITWPYLWNGEGDRGATGAAYGRGTPHFLLIGPRRTLLDQWRGYSTTTYGELIERINKTLVP